MKKKAIKELKEWISWSLQSLTWIAGIAVAIKELIPKEIHTKGLFDHAVVNPRVGLLVGTAVVVLLISAGMKYWREKE